jgi:hypothetical protein
MAVELRNALSVATGREQPPTLLFDHPTLDALVEHLGRGLLVEPQPAPATASPGAAPPPSPERLDQLSEGELAELLAREIESLHKTRAR